LFSFLNKFFYSYFYVHIIWIRSKPCITHVDEIRTYMN
jgi:hypothetical protein